MFERWFNAFQDNGGDETKVDVEISTGDGGHPGKDLNAMLSGCITDDNKLRIVVSE